MSDLKSFTKFVPLVKAEEQPDGTMKVYGLVTAEQPDRDAEVCHYASTVPFYRAMAEEFKKATSIPGVDPSIAPLRYMHGPDAVGKGTQMDFDDANKSIMMGFDVIDKAAIEKVKKGVLTGFSQGGQYAKTWRQNGTDGKEYLYYTAKVGEISLVDSPCLETARFEYVKADGSKELRKFSRDEPAAQAVEPPGAGVVLSTSDVLRVAAATAAMMKAEKDEDEDDEETNKTTGAPSGEPNGSASHKPTEGPPVPASQVSDMGVGDAKLAPVEPLLFADKFRAAAAKAGIEKGTEAEKIKAAYWFMGSKSIPVTIRESVFKSIFKPDVPDPKINEQTYAVDLVRACNSEAPGAMAKSLWDVKDLVDVIHTLCFVQRCLHDEAMYENDDSAIPGDLVELLERLCEIFIALVGEETAELLAAISGQKGAVKATMNTELEKAKHSLAQHLKAGHAMVSDHHESTVGMHKAHHDAMHKHIDGVMKALKATIDCGLLKGEDLAKAKDANEKLEAMKSAVTAHMDKGMGKSSSFHKKMRGHLNKMAKAIGAEEENVEGSGPDDETVTESGSEGAYPGTAHPHEGKFLTAAEMVKILDERDAARDAREEDSITKFVQALNANNGAAVPGAAAGPQFVETGIGNRNQVVKTANAPYQTHIVNKDQDTSGATNLNKGPDVSAQLKDVDVSKALVQGDANEMLKIARTITPAAGGIPTHLSGIKVLNR